MKFGKRLLRQAHQEWSSFYIDYRALKQELKQATECGDCTGSFWISMLHTELQKVNNFYLEKERTLSSQFVNLQELEDSEKDEELTTSSIANFCRILELLRYYVVLNYMAVYKITKKRNKLLNSAPSLDFLSILMEQPFYTSIKLARITVKTELLALKLIPGETIDENNFTCPICLFVLCNPVVLSCTHRFCWTCLSKTSECIQSCPVCRKDLKLDPKNFNIDWILKEFLLKQFPESQTDLDKTPKISRDGLIKQLENRASTLDNSSNTEESNAQIPAQVPQASPVKSPLASDSRKIVECKYTVVSTIGKGVFGEIFLANHKSNPKAPPVALKKIPKNHEKFKKSAIVKEMNAGKMLKHDSVINFIDSFETVSSIYFVLEYFDGKDLYTLMEDRNYKPYSEETAKQIFHQLLDALDYCQSNGVAHRDVKLENIMMNKSGKIKLIDFGLCDMVLDPNGQERTCNDSVGSPAYIAPEILTGSPYYSFKSDVWSAGVVLYAMMFGRFPYSPSQYRLLVEGEQVALELPTFGSEAVKSVIRSALTLDPSKRPTVQDLMHHEWLSAIPKKPLLVKMFDSVPIQL